MEKYLKFSVRQTVQLNESIVCEEKHFDKGHTFTIISFPACTILSKRTHFVYGKFGNQMIRCEVNQISNLKKNLI